MVGAARRRSTGGEASESSSEQRIRAFRHANHARAAPAEAPHEAFQRVSMEYPVWMLPWTGWPDGARSLIRKPWAQYGLAVGLVAAALVLRLALEPALEGQAPFVTFFLPILFV